MIYVINETSPLRCLRSLPSPAAGRVKGQARAASHDQGRGAMCRGRENRAGNVRASGGKAMETHFFESDRDVYAILFVDQND